MATVEQECAGYIQLVFFDALSGEVVILGGAGFLTLEEAETAWNTVPEFQGVDSSFMADRMDSDRNITEDRVISAETCQTLLGQPIAKLIAVGRAKLALDVARYRKVA